MKKKLSQTLYENKHWVYVLLIIAIGIFIRVVSFGSIPGGFNQDEAFAGYEAFSLLNYGVDSSGYHNPCYFVAWGSGMNVLESYLAIPIMKLFGCSVITLRLPQLICSCICLPVFYLLLKEMFSKKVALLGLGLLAISPWHIMISRWGLESNLAPAFLLFGFFFLVKGLKSGKYLIFSAITYGMALYAYSITWLVVPITIFLWGIYIIFTKQNVSIKYLLISGAVLFIFALPLILFMLVNKNIIPEIVTDFISIPKLLAMRDGEISINNLFTAKTYYDFLDLFVKQNDPRIWNVAKDFGLFYKISLPFIILGGVRLASDFFRTIRKRIFSFEALIFLGAIASVLSCLLIKNLNVNKANSLHFYMIIMLTIGIREICIICKNHSIVKRSIACVYAVMFIFFSSYYLGTYNDAISPVFKSGLEDSVNYVKTQGFSSITVDSSIFYPQILFFDQTPTDDFLKTVEYTNYPSAFLQVRKFGKYKFGINSSYLNSKEAYIIKSQSAADFKKQGFHVESFDNFSVAHKSE